MLARHGYGVLLFDRRGEGESEGDPNSWGWGGEEGHQGRDRVPPAPARRRPRPDRRHRPLGRRRDDARDRRRRPTTSRPSCPRAPARARSPEDLDQDVPAAREGARRRRCPRSRPRRSRVSSNQAPPANLKDLAAKIAQPLLLIAAPNSATARSSTAATTRRPASPRRCGRSPSPSTSAAWRRGRRSTSGAWSASSTRRCCHEPPPHGDARSSPPRPRWLLVHALDDAFVAPRAGLGARPARAGRACSRSSAGLAGVRRVPALRPGLRAALAFAFGGLALVNGALHVSHIATDGAGGSDVTGVLAALAGVVLVGLAAAIPWRHRGERATRGRRWTTACSPCRPRSSASCSCSARSRSAIVETHKWREPVGAPPSAAYAEISFEASDGLSSRAGTGRRATARACSSCTAAAATATAPWPTPRCSPATATASCSTTPAGAARATAAPNNYGWDWAKDVDGALASSRQRDDVDPAGSARSASRPAPTS